MLVPRAPASLVLVLAAAAPAQFLVSPAHYAAHEGAMVGSPPFSGTAFPVRYQQVHGDLRGSARVITSLALRRDGGFRGDARFAARNLDLEVVMADSDLALLSTDFARNYAGTPLTVLPRTVVSSPDWSAAPRQSPAPFDFALPFAAPFPAAGALDLLWEVTVHGATGAGTALPADLCNSGFNLVIPAAYRMLGSGCTVGGQEMELRHAVSLQAFPVNGWILDWAATNCPPSAPGVLLLGTVDPDLQLPGLCSRVRVLPVAQVPGVSDANGEFDPFPSTSPLPRHGYAPALVGAQLLTQVAVADGTRPGIPVAVSNGLATVLPDWTPTIALSRVYQVPPATTPVLSAGTGLPVRFGL